MTNSQNLQGVSPEAKKFFKYYFRNSEIVKTCANSMLTICAHSQILFI